MIGIRGKVGSVLYLLVYSGFCSCEQRPARQAFQLPTAFPPPKYLVLLVPETLGWTDHVKLALVLTLYAVWIVCLQLFSVKLTDQLLFVFPMEGDRYVS